MKIMFDMFVCLINRILYIFNEFDKRNETFIIRLIITGGTSGQNLTRLRRLSSKVMTKVKVDNRYVQIICI